MQNDKHPDHENATNILEAIKEIAHGLWQTTDSAALAASAQILTELRNLTWTLDSWACREQSGLPYNHEAKLSAEPEADEAEFYDWLDTTDC